MANPQVENGHLKIANEVWEHLASASLLGSEFQVLLAIIRKTWGWKKKRNELALSELCLLTALPHATAARAMKTLLEKGMLSQVKGGGRGKRSQWSFVKDWEVWKLSHAGDSKINSPRNETEINCPMDESSSVSPTGQINITDETVSRPNPLIPVAPASPKATSKERKAIQSHKQHETDSRLAPLKVFIEAEYLRARLCKLITDKSDWIQVNTMLRRTNGTFSAEQLEKAWTSFLESPSRFHQEQGHPLRWWASNLNAFVGIKAAPKSLFESVEDHNRRSLEEARRKLEHQPGR